MRRVKKQQPLLISLHSPLMIEYQYYYDMIELSFDIEGHPEQ